MSTINEQIKSAQDAIRLEEFGLAQDIIEILLARRANKTQLVEIEALVALLDEAQPAYRMSNQLAKYRSRYHTSIAASGAKSLSNGDDLANFLEMKDAKAVCALADVYTPNKDGQPHIERYAKLNEGQKRMNSGNKLRAAIKRGALVVTEQGLEAA